MRGDEALGYIRSSHPAVRVLAVSSYHDPQYIQGMLERGAAGYITKDEAPELLLGAIRSLAKGVDHWISPRAGKSANRTTSEDQTLTTREAQILEGLSGSLSAAQISEQLEMDVSQVEKHIRLLQVKFGVGSLAELIRSIQGKSFSTR
jgi:DNA-binding NarL/FixJ family response regulator